MTTYEITPLTEQSTCDWLLYHYTEEEGKTLSISFDYAVPCVTPEGFTSLTLYRKSTGSAVATIKVSNLEIENKRLKNILLNGGEEIEKIINSQS